LYFEQAKVEVLRRMLGEEYYEREISLIMERLKQFEKKERLFYQNLEEIHDRRSRFMFNLLMAEEIRFTEKIKRDPTNLREAFGTLPESKLEFRKLFDMYALYFGFRVLHSGVPHPDYILLRGDIRRYIRAEAELKSKNYIHHGHNPTACDMVLCWEHNCPMCELKLDVFELSTGMMYLTDGTIERILPGIPNV